MKGLSPSLKVAWNFISTGRKCFCIKRLTNYAIGVIRELLWMRKLEEVIEGEGGKGGKRTQPK